MFPRAEVTGLDEHQCNRGHEDGGGVQWFLVVDKYEFHVYVAAVCRQFQVRIDWHQDSTLTYRPFHFDQLEQNIAVGRGHWFCKPCIETQLRHGMQEYRLFHFNCRTLSYLILTRVAQFDPDEVYAKFDKLRLLCGLQPVQCLSLDEIHRYVAYKKENKTECRLF